MEKSTVHDLVSKIKRYFSLQRDFVMLSLTEKLTLLLTAVVVGGVMLVMALLVLIFLSATVSGWLSGVIGSVVGANAIVGVFYLVLAWVVYVNRKRWIADRVARFLASILLEDVDDSDTANDSQKD